MERSRLTVSPFDGANRIRFLGSPTHCRFAIVDCRLNSSFQIGNWKLAISNNPGLSALILCGFRLPRNAIWFSNYRNLRTLRRSLQTKPECAMRSEAGAVATGVAFGRPRSRGD